GDSKAGIELRNAPGTELRGNYITGGTDDFWAIRLKKDKGTNGRGKGIPSDIMMKCNVIRQATNGIKIEAGRNLKLLENIIEGIDEEEIKVSDDIDVIQKNQRCT